jgi:WD40 repeat protein
VPNYQKSHLAMKRSLHSVYYKPPSLISAWKKSQHITDTITSIAFSADGRGLVSGSADQTLRFWQPAAGRSEGILATTGVEVRQVAISGDSSRLAVAQNDGAVRILNLSAISPSLTCAGDRSSFLNSIAFDTDGSRLLSTFWGFAGSIRVSDLSTCHTLATYSTGTPGMAVLAMSPEGKRFATGSLGGIVEIWDLTAGRRIWQSDRTGKVRALTYSPDGTRIIATADHDIRVWRLAATRRRDAERWHAMQHRTSILLRGEWRRSR